jgi:HSP20 family protein
MILKQRIDGSTLNELASDFENLFEHVFGGETSNQNSWTPRANVLESEAAYFVELELPGLSGDDVSVELVDGSLVISGEKSVGSEDEGVQVLRSERRSGSFRRSFKFSTQLNAEKIAANFNHGILRVELSKSEQVLPRKIDVKIG